MTQPTPRADCALARLVVLCLLHQQQPQTVTREMVAAAAREYKQLKEAAWTAKRHLRN